MDRQDLFITEKELAKILKCSISKLRQDRHLGRGFPYYKIDRKVLYKQEEALQRVEANKIETT